MVFCNRPRHDYCFFWNKSPPNFLKSIQDSFKMYLNINISKKYLMDSKLYTPPEPDLINSFLLMTPLIIFLVFLSLQLDQLVDNFLLFSFLKFLLFVFSQKVLWNWHSVFIPLYVIFGLVLILPPLNCIVDNYFFISCDSMFVIINYFLYYI